MLFFALPKSNFSTSEKRYLADTPKFSLENLFSGQLVKEIDGDSEKGTSGYVSDHFPLRTFWVGLNSYYHLSFGNTANSDYYFAKDGFIVTKPYETGTFGENLNVTVGIVPSAGNILEDKLPLNHISYPDNEVYETLKNSLSDSINYCDLESVMQDFYAEGNAPYYKTDHHWTTPAAFKAYEKLAENLGYTPVMEEGFEKTVYNNFYGTTYSSSGYFLSDPDVIEVWKGSAEESVTVEICEGESISTFSSMYIDQHLSEPDMYPVFLDGNHSLVKIKNPNAEGGKLLVIKDSYAHALVPFLAENYSEIVMVDMRYFKENVTDLCANEGITDALVLYSISNFCTDTGLAFLE